MQDKLAETVETDGVDAFKKELARLQEGRGKRGIPKGKYVIVRTVFDRRYRPDMDLYAKLEELARTKEKKVDEYCKDVLKDHIKNL
jgi:ERCC4-related helicase